MAIPRRKVVKMPLVPHSMSNFGASKRVKGKANGITALELSPGSMNYDKQYPASYIYVLSIQYSTLLKTQWFITVIFVSIQMLPSEMAHPHRLLHLLLQ